MKQDKVKSIEYLDELPDCTYNLHIDGNNNYFVDGILVHNCEDDPQDPLTAEQEVERERVVKHWKETLYNRLTPINLGIRILLQQRLHEEDLSGHLLK